MFPSTSLRFDGSSGGRFPSLEDDVEAGCYRLDDGRCPPEKVGQSSSHDGCVLSSIDERESMRPSVPPCPRSILSVSSSGGRRGGGTLSTGQPSMSL